MRTTATAIIAALTAATGALLLYEALGQEEKSGTEHKKHKNVTLHGRC